MRTVLNYNWFTLQPNNETERTEFHKFRLNDIAWMYKFFCLLKVFHWLTFVGSAVRDLYPEAWEICGLQSILLVMRTLVLVVGLRFK